MKTSNHFSYDKVNNNLSVTGNYVDAISLEGRAILITHRYRYNSVWLNFNQENLNTTLRVTTPDNNTIDFIYNTQYITDGTGDYGLKKSNTIILPIQHKNIQLITNPTYVFENTWGACTIYYDAGLVPIVGNPFLLKAYTEADAGGSFICRQLYFSAQDPGDCDSDGVVDAVGDFYGYWLTFELGTC